MTRNISPSLPFCSFIYSFIHLRYIAMQNSTSTLTLPLGSRLLRAAAHTAWRGPPSSSPRDLRSSVRTSASPQWSDVPICPPFAIAAGRNRSRCSAALPEVSTAETLPPPSLRPRPSEWVALCSMQTASLCGPDGKPMFATDERVPPGGTIGAGGVVLDKNGHLCMGPDGKPMVVTIAAAQAFANPEKAETEGAVAATDVAAVVADAPGGTPATAEKVDAPAVEEPRPEAKTEVPKSSSPTIVSPSAASQAIGSVKQYARKHEGSSSSPKQMIGKITAAFGRSPGPTTPSVAQQEKHDQKKFEIPPPATGPSIVTGEGLGGQGRIYETTEDGQLIIPGNWFEKYKQREYLGGMMRTPAQLKQLALHDQLAAQVASAGKSGSKQHSVIGRGHGLPADVSDAQGGEAMQEQVVVELCFPMGLEMCARKLKTPSTGGAMAGQISPTRKPRHQTVPADWVHRATLRGTKQNVADAHVGAASDGGVASGRRFRASTRVVLSMPVIGDRQFVTRVAGA